MMGSSETGWTQKAIVEAIFSMEQRFDLLSGRGRTSALWERMRFFVYRDIIQMLGLENPPISRVTLRKKALSWHMRTLVESIRSVTLRNALFMPGRKEYLFYCNQRRRLNEKEEYEDIWCDPIIERLGIDKVGAVENPLDFRHLQPARTKNLFYTDFVLAVAAFMTRLKKSAMDTATFRLLEEHVNETFHIRVALVKRAIAAEKRRLVWRRVFRHLLRRINPKVLFLVCSYGKEEIVEAARSLGIMTVELQHGIITPFHLGYSYPRGFRKRAFPDLFFAFGRHWAEAIDFPIHRDAVLNVGYSFLNKGLCKYQHVGKKNQIIFISQGTTGKEIVNFVLRYLRERESDIDVVFKLHPGEYERWEEYYPELEAAHRTRTIRVVKGSSSTLYELLAESRWQVGVNSTALYEGIAFGCKTFVLKCTGYEYMQDLIANNDAMLVDPDEEFDLRWTGNEEIGIDKYFRPDWEHGLDMAMEEVKRRLANA